MSTNPTVPTEITLKTSCNKITWYLYRSERCSISKVNNNKIHGDEVKVARKLMNEGDEVANFVITNGHNHNIICCGSCESKECQCQCIVTCPIDRYLALYLSTKFHNREHVSQELKLSSKENSV